MKYRRIVLLMVSMIPAGCLMPEPAAAQWPVLEGLSQWEQAADGAAALADTPAGMVLGDERLSMNLNGHWYQRIGDSGDWTRVLVPDQWVSRGEQHHRWYVRRFHLPAAFTGKRVVLEFMAVRMYAEVFLNGQKIGSHAGAYTPFQVDATSAAQIGRSNTLLVYVKDESYALDGDKLYHQVSGTNMIPSGSAPEPPLDARGGIWQDVMLHGLNPVYVSDVHIVTSTRNRTIQASVTVRNDDTIARNIAVVPQLLEWPSAKPAEITMTPATALVQPGTDAVLEFTQSWQNPNLWSPERPFLYWLQTQIVYPGADETVRDSLRTRFGFREFWIDGADFYLNGKKTRLRGNSQIDGHSGNPFLWRDDYARQYLQVVKTQIDLNSFRVHAAIGAPSIFKAADEVGLLLIDQSAIWSRGSAYYRRGGQRFLDNTRKEFEEWIRRDRNHPSVVIWGAENEMLRIDVDGNWEWAQQLPGFIRAWDATRPVQFDGGGGCNDAMEIYHIHHHENYTMLYDAWRKRRDKPMIAGEWWVGGRNGERRLTTGQEYLDYQEYLEKSAVLFKERLDEQRVNGLAGIMPFNWMEGWASQLFLPQEAAGVITWPDVTAQGPKPADPPRYLHMPEWNVSASAYRIDNEVARAFRGGLSSIHVAFRENSGNYYGKEILKKDIVVSNDTENPQDMTLTWMLREDLMIRKQDRATKRVEPGEQWVFPLEIELPGRSSAGHLTISASVVQGARVQSQDNIRLTVYPEDVAQFPGVKKKIGIYDPAGSLKHITDNAGDKLQALTGLSNLDGLDALIIGESVDAQALQEAGPQVNAYIAAGGRVLLMQQDKAPAWLPAPFGMLEFRPMPDHNEFRIFGFTGWEKGIYQSRYAAVHAQQHPALKGIPETLMQWWRAGDGRLADEIYIRPQTADAPVNVNVRSILGGTRREYSSLLEILQGRGMLILCQLHIGDNYPADPEAVKVFHNLVEYLQADSPLDPGKQVAVAGMLDQGGLKNWVTSIDMAALDEKLPRYAALLLGPNALLTDKREQRLYDYVRHGGIVIVTPGAPIPVLMKDNVMVETPEAEPTLVMVRDQSRLVSGINSYDFEYWPVPPAAGILRVRASVKTGGMLMAANVQHTTGGSGRQLDNENFRPLGFVLAEFPFEDGSYVISQIPIPAANNWQGMMVYSALFTNLGVAVK